MKKQWKRMICGIAALALALTTVAAGGIRAKAQEYEMVVRWSDLMPVLVEYELKGDYVKLGDSGIVYWVSDRLAPIELTQEDIDEGYIAAYDAIYSDDAMISLMYADQPATLRSYTTFLKRAGVTEWNEYTVNGLDIIEYDVPDEDVRAFAFENPKEPGIYEIAVSPAYDDEELEILSSVMLSSLQKCDTLSWTLRDRDAVPEGEMTDVVIPPALRIGDPSLQFYLPDDYRSVKLSRSEIESGLIAYYEARRYDNSAILVSCIAAADSAGDFGDFTGYNLDLLYALLEEMEAEDIELLSVNGRYMLKYWDVDDEATCVAFPADSGDVIRFSFDGSDRENWTEDQKLIVSSVQSRVAAFNWSDVADYVDEELGGDVIAYSGVDFAHWLPAGFESIELEDEDYQAGYIGYFENEADEQIIAVQCWDVGGAPLESVRSLLVNSGAEEMQDILVNGERAITYVMPASDVRCVTMTSLEGYLLETTFYPASDDDMMEIAEIFTASLHLGLMADGNTEIDKLPDETPKTSYVEDTEELDTITDSGQRFTTKIPGDCGAGFRSDGLYIYTGGGGGIPYVLIYRNNNVKFTSEEFLEDYILPNMVDSYGDDMIDVGELTTWYVGGKKLPGILFRYYVGEYEVNALRLVMQKGNDLIGFTVKYLDQNEDATLHALEVIVRNLQLLDEKGNVIPDENGQAPEKSRGMLNGN